MGELLCDKCGNKMILLSGSIFLQAHDEPYEAGKYEDVDLTINESVYADYCEHCDEFKYLVFEERQGELKQ